MNTVAENNELITSTDVERRRSGMKNQQRIEAEKQYKKALVETKKAENQPSEEVYNAALAALDSARKHLVQMEIKWPTSKEKRAESNYLYLANRGLA